MSPDPSVTFPEFVFFWNRLQHQSTPRVQVQMGQWLHTCTQNESVHMLLMAFRGAGKSTIAALYAAWTLRCAPATRILVVSAHDHVATRLVRHTRRIIETHPLTAHLVPSNPDQWAADRFTVARDLDLADPSCVGRGITGNITGLRADLIICDDVEVPNTADTGDKRDELRARLQELRFIQTPHARTLYIGTPHVFDTIYRVDACDDIPGHVPFLAGYEVCALPVTYSNGASRWPEKFNLDYLAQMRQQVGAALYESQMMLRPVNVATLRLDPAMLQVYEDDVALAPDSRALYIGQTKISSCSAWWDPSYGASRGDSSVLAIVYTDPNGHLYLHHLSYLKTDQADEPARAQCDAVAALCARFQVPVVGLETNGIGGFLPGLLRQALTRARAPTAVRPHHQNANKTTRILSALETPLAARMLHVHRSVLETPFLQEMRDFVPGAPNARDDGLDAVSGAIALEPIRLPPSGPRPPPLWRSRPFHLITGGKI